MTKSHLTVIALVLFVGCKNNLVVKESNSVQLDIPKFTQTLATNMANRKLEISKTFELNETSETKKYTELDSSFWTKELIILEKIDLNSPQLNGTFEVEKGMEDQFSNLLIDKYSFIVDTDVGINSLSVYYLDDATDIRQIRAELASNNFIAKANSKFSIWMNRYGDDLLIDSLEVVSQGKTLMQPARNYRSLTKTHR